MYITHNLSYSPEFYTWGAMKQRCLNPNSKSFGGYGGRGISICESWLLFENFYRDLGPRPSKKHSIERRNNNGNYEPGNVYWATREQQENNKRSNHPITCEGQTLNIGQWAKLKNLTGCRIRARMNAGWSLERTLNERPNIK